MTHASREVLTHLELTWLEKRIEQWLRFGHALETHPIDRYRRRLSFAPGAVFALLRWTQADCGTTTCCIDIIRAPLAGEPRERLPFVPTGAQRLVVFTGWPQVRDVLSVIERLERQGVNPVDVDPEYWRHLGRSRPDGLDIPRYSATRHAAWQRRRTVP